MVWGEMLKAVGEKISSRIQKNLKLAKIQPSVCFFSAYSIWMPIAPSSRSSSFFSYNRSRKDKNGPPLPTGSSDFPSQPSLLALATKSRGAL
jgi:hypothetical protein